MMSVRRPKVGCEAATAAASMPLDRAAAGVRVKVIGLNCGGSCNHMLSERGIRVGEVLAVCHRAPMGGPVWVEIRGAMFAIGRGVAHKILVSALAPG